MAITVLMLIFPGVNTLDVNGPLEVLCNTALRTNPDGTPKPAPYKIYIASKCPIPAQAWEFIHLAADTTFQEATRMIENHQIDVLIVPGYSPSTVGSQLIQNEDDIFTPMRAFLSLKVTTDTSKSRWMISICVGALLMNHIGAFDGRKATTHFKPLEKLQQDPEQKAEWVRSRWVDGGETDNHIRILSAGGISCGIDCMLWFVSQTLSLADAQLVAYFMDYEWNGGVPGSLPTTKQLPSSYQQ